MFNYWGYGRISTQGQAGEGKYGLVVQEKDVREEALKLGGEIKEFFSDIITGTSSIRTGLDTLLREANAGDVVIFPNVKRIGRDVLIIAGILTEFINAKLRVYAVGIGEFIGNDAASLTQWLISMLVADLDHKSIINRLRKGADAKLASGKLLRRVDSYGYTSTSINNKIEVEINEAEAIHVRYIFDRALHVGIRQIALELNEMGVPAPTHARSKKTDLWFDGTTRVILRNENYFGEYRYGRTVTCDCGNKFSIPKWKVAEHYDLTCERCNGIMTLHRFTVPIPAIIDEELFNRANDASRKRQKTKPGLKLEKYPLQGKVYCGECGRTFGGRTNSNIVRATFYACNGRKDGLLYKLPDMCSHKRNYPTKAIHDLVVQAIRQVFESEPDNVESMFMLPEVKHKDYSGQVQALETERKRLIGFLGKGLISEDDFKIQDKDIKQQIKIFKTQDKKNQPVADVTGWKNNVESLLNGNSLRKLFEVSGVHVELFADGQVKVSFR